MWKQGKGNRTSNFVKVCHSYHCSIVYLVYLKRVCLKANQLSIICFKTIKNHLQPNCFNSSLGIRRDTSSSSQIWETKSCSFHNQPFKHLKNSYPSEKRTVTSWRNSEELVMENSAVRPLTIIEYVVEGEGNANLPEIGESFQKEGYF